MKIRIRNPPPLARLPQTKPNSPPNLAMPPDISPVALTGFSKATSYDAHRPSYPPAAVSALLKHLEIDNELQGRIVDLAAGTGKFTELLTQREEGYEILAVEPHEGMRGVLEGKGLKGVKVLEGSAEIMMGVEKGWAAAVIVAQVGLVSCGDSGSGREVEIDGG